LKLTFRAKLTSIILLTTLAFGSVLLISSWLGWREARDLEDVEGRMVPKLELGPRLESEFEHLRQSMQDAVAAQDPAALDESIQLRNAFIASVSGAGAALTPAEAAQLRHAVTAYHEAAYGVSRRLLRGETGEALVDALAAMQAQQHATEALISSSARLDRHELAGGFAAVRRGITAGSRYALLIGLGNLALVLGLAAWTGRAAVTALTNLSSGVARFATGDFREPIPVRGADELATLAVETNRMAEALRRSDWLQTGLARLSDELRTELEPDEAARRALAFLCRRARAVAGILYSDDGEGTLQAQANYASDLAQTMGVLRSFRLGEGLVGEAAAAGTVVVVNDPPAGYFTIRSGLGEAGPRSLVLAPLRRADCSIGVVELALFEPCSGEVRDFIEAAREIIVISLQMARSRATQRDLLDKSQKQADLLAAQEEELRASNRDLTDQQEELRRANVELEEQREALSTQNVELERVREGLVDKAAELARVSSYKSQFLANMSHELRTPLNSMLLLSHLLSENESKNLNAKQVDYAKTIHSAGKDLLGLINQVLDLAKIEAGRQDLDLGEVRLAELVERAERLFAAAAHEKQLAFRTELARDLPEAIVTDGKRLDRILVNLVGNALKFTEHGSVTLRITRPAAALDAPHGRLEPATSLAFAVSDTGIGIPRGAQERIFAPFEQADARTDRRFGGTGLGLAIARESAVLLGGTLEVESREGQGSTFTCTLPERPAARQAQPETRGPTGPVTPVQDDRAHVEPEGYLLVVEDDPTFAERLVALIHGQHFKAVVATNGEDALRLARAQKPRGVILDVKLPDVDGWSVMESLQRDRATRSVPVHFISGVDAPERAFSLGAVGYLTKPATPSELLGAIRLLVRSPETADSRVLVVEDEAIQAGAVVELLRSAGLAAEHVTSARAALEALERERFGCMVLDLGLPDMDGLGLLETLRTRSEVPMPRVVVHTGRSLTREEIRRIEAYAEAVVVKGGNSGERLLEEVRLFVEHVRAGASRPLALGANTEPLPDVSLEGERILLADDDMRTVYALSALLRGKGAEVLVAENGREALELLFARPDVSIVLMDVMMPEMDGYEALRRMRADGRFGTLPAIALTAKAMKGERERCIAAGATDYLAKPVDPGRLLKTLAGALKANGA
jgi:CheY-like chemotaxis protein/signal transduction histidine kinase